jgi:hypothetical protein
MKEELKMSVKAVGFSREEVNAKVGQQFTGHVRVL